jgi:hypothetical protein
MRKMITNKKYYCLSTKWQHEKKALFAIQNMKCDCFIPLVKRMTTNNTQKSKLLIPIYIFFQLSWTELISFHDFSFISRYIPFGQKNPYVDDDSIDTLKKKEGARVISNNDSKIKSKKKTIKTDRNENISGIMVTIKKENYIVLNIREFNTSLMVNVNDYISAFYCM